MKKSSILSSAAAGAVMFAVMCAGFAIAEPQHAAAPIHVPLTADHWRVISPIPGAPKPDISFLRQEGFPNGLLVLKAGSAAFDSLRFRNGTIEFDMKGIGEGIPGIQFRKQGAERAENGEEFYVRTSPDCRASNDCIQYTPVIHGFMLWNSYPQYQTQAFLLDGWNHIKLVISGRRMNVYINHLPQPALLIGSLESDSTEGHIELRGPAYFANLTVTPDAVEGLAAAPTPDPAAADRAMVRQWQLGPLTQFAGTAPAYANMPDRASAWKTLTAGRFGMLNLNREFPLNFDPPPLTWLRTTVISDRAQNKHVAMGWLGRAWVFVNGKLATQGNNLYNVEGQRREPDGRMSLENGSFDLPLNAGANEVAIALVPTINPDKTPNRYGWGLEMRFADLSGIRLADNPAHVPTRGK